MNLKYLCQAAGLWCDFDDIDIEGIKTNSKEVEKGDLFVCLRGLKHDGHDFVTEACKRGAVAILCERNIDADAPIVVAENTRKALPLLYNAWYGFPTKNLKLVAVTGTNGKTTVTYMIKSILDASMKKVGLIGTVDSYLGDKKLEKRSPSPEANMTTPDPDELFRLLYEMEKGGAEYVVMEASSHALALDKLEGLEFEAAVFTNLGAEHLDFHSDMEDYFKAKSKLFDRAKIKIVNTDDAYGKRIKATYPDALGCSAVRKCCDFFASDINDLGMDGSEYCLASDGRRFLVRTPMIGRFNVMNTLEAAACALKLGVSPYDVKCALSTMDGVKGRLERVKLGAVSDYSLFIDYAHTPDALENLLDTVCRLRKCDSRVVVLFGCGGDRDKSKRRKMGEIASKYADFTVVTSDNSRSEEPSDIISEILVGVGKAPHAVIEKRAEAIEYVIKNAQKRDIILLVGKGHEEYEIDKSGKHRFSEREIAAMAVEKYS